MVYILSTDKVDNNHIIGLFLKLNILFLLNFNISFISYFSNYLLLIKYFLFKYLNLFYHFSVSKIVNTYQIKAVNNNKTFLNKKKKVD